MFALSDEEQSITSKHIDAYIQKVTAAEDNLAKVHFDDVSPEEKSIVEHIRDFTYKQLAFLRHAIYIEAVNGGYELDAATYTFHKQKMDELLDEIY
jgi:hypothetical protein